MIPSRELGGRGRANGGGGGEAVNRTFIISYRGKVCHAVHVMARFVNSQRMLFFLFSFFHYG